MYGFIGTFGKGVIKTISTDSNMRTDKVSDFLVETIETENYTVKRKSVNKFDRDKCFSENDKLIIATEGIIYNRKELQEKYKAVDLFSLVEAMYLQNGERFVEEFNGVFAIVLIDKLDQKPILYASHMAYRPLYYYLHEGQLLFSTDIAWMYQNIRNNVGEIELDSDGAYCLLTMGYMVDEKTLVKGVKKVVSGEYVTISNGISQRNIWWDINDFEEKQYNYDELLEKVDNLFCKAVKTCYDLDKDYGYTHFCTLSGGLDSRCVAMVSDELGYKDQKFVTMCQSGNIEGVIASKIASRLHQDHILYDMDNGIYCAEIEKAVLANGGLISFSGFMGISKICDLFYKENYGAIQTGEVGDVVMGGSFVPFKKGKYKFSDGAFSTRLIKRISKEFVETQESKHKNGSNYALVNRGVNGCENGWVAGYAYTESTSVFIDRDLFEFCLTIPARILESSEFYINWMKKYHPLMCEFDWAKTCGKPSNSYLYTKYKRAVKKLQHKLLKKQFIMNPYQVWYDNGTWMKKYYDGVYEKDVPLIKDKQLYEDCKEMYNKGSIHEKMQVLTLLKAIEVFEIKA